MAKPFIVYVTRKVLQDGSMLVYANNVEEAEKIQRDFIADDFNWDTVDYLDFKVTEITELDESTLTVIENGESEYYG